MGILAAIKRLAFSFLMTFNWVYAFFSRRPKLHGSRFAPRMRPLLTETVICSLSGADFAPAGLMSGDNPVSVYLRWPERDLLQPAAVLAAVKAAARRLRGGLTANLDRRLRAAAYRSEVGSEGMVGLPVSPKEWASS